MKFSGMALVSLMCCVIPVLADDTVSINQGAEWQPITNPRFIEPGSVMDFSFLSDAPAGKYGRVVIRDGHFEFADRPGERVKFFGPNLCYDLNFPTKENALKLAEYLKRTGYNIVRIHHYDVGLVAHGGEPINEEKLNRLDYLIWCLKERGIYIVLDFHTSREFAANEVPEYGKAFCRQICDLIQLSPDAKKAWESFVRKILTHRNPYTKMTLAEDPVFVGGCPVNEDFTYHGLPVSPMYAKAYDQWLKKNGIKVKNESENLAAYMQFQVHLQQETYEYYRKVFKSLGTQMLMSGANNVEYKILTSTRQTLDYVDNHIYWNHPDFLDTPWRLPWKQLLTVSELSRCSGNHRVFGHCRIIGKPFTVTEFNYCYPNFFRAEGGSLMGSYAAFQDWDALFRFDFGHDADVLDKDGPAYVFGSVYDPIAQMTEKMIALLFLRGDVAKAKTIIPYLTTEKITCETFNPNGDYFSNDLRLLTLCVGVGTIDTTNLDLAKLGYKDVIVPREWKKNIPNARVFRDSPLLIPQLIASGAIQADHCQRAKNIYVSDTNEIELDGNRRLFKAVTPRSEAFTFEQEGSLAGNCVTVNNAGGTCTVFVSAVDGKPIAQSSRLLVLHLTDVQNDKIEFSKDYTIWKKQGQLPHMVRSGTARIELRLDAPQDVRVWAVDLAGKRQHEISVTRKDSTVSFPMKTVSKDGAFMAYEVQRQTPANATAAAGEK